MVLSFTGRNVPDDPSKGWVVRRPDVVCTTRQRLRLRLPAASPLCQPPPPHQSDTSPITPRIRHRRPTFPGRLPPGAAVARCGRSPCLLSSAGQSTALVRRCSTPGSGRGARQTPVGGPSVETTEGPLTLQHTFSTHQAAAASPPDSRAASCSASSRAFRAAFSAFFLAFSSALVRWASRRSETSSRRSGQR